MSSSPACCRTVLETFKGSETGLRKELKHKIVSAASQGRTRLLVEWDEVTNKDLYILGQKGLHCTYSKNKYQITWDTFWMKSGRDSESFCAIL